MRELNDDQVLLISGGISLRVAIFSVVAGFIGGGPAGAGIALCAIVGAQGIDNLNNELDF